MKFVLRRITGQQVRTLVCTMMILSPSTAGLADDLSEGLTGSVLVQDPTVFGLSGAWTSKFGLLGPEPWVPNPLTDKPPAPGMVPRVVLVEESSGIVAHKGWTFAKAKPKPCPSRCEKPPTPIFIDVRHGGHCCPHVTNIITITEIAQQPIVVPVYGGCGGYCHASRGGLYYRYHR